ncbi:MAG: hypothetical protein ACFCUX_09565, partial [Candidatus Methylacidiphilales bacterium]
INAQALGGGGVKIYGGSVLTANQQVQLFGNNAVNGIRFIANGNGDITISSPDVLMKAPLIQVDNAVAVNVGTGNAGDLLKIDANTRNFSGGGFGNINLNGDVIPNAVGGGTVTGGATYQVNPF